MKPPLTTTTSIWPAAAVLGVAVVMLFIFLFINLIADPGVAPTPMTLPLIVGGLAKAPSAAVLDFCARSTEIPFNIGHDFVVPLATKNEPGAKIPNAGAGDFDCYQPLVTRANSASLLAFYASQLEARGWSLFSHGASNGSPQFLFQKAGSDGFYWVAGVTVTNSRAGSVYWTFRIYQNSETV